MIEANIENENVPAQSYAFYIDDEQSHTLLVCFYNPLCFLCFSLGWMSEWKLCESHTVA